PAMPPPPRSSASRSLCFHRPAPTEIYTLSLHDALPIFILSDEAYQDMDAAEQANTYGFFRIEIADSAGNTSKNIVVGGYFTQFRSEEHTSELQSRENLVCRLLLEKKKHNATTLPHETTK